MSLTSRVLVTMDVRFKFIRDWINSCAEHRGTFGWIALMIENPQRQPEIALYIFTQALRILHNMGKRRSLY